MAWTYDTSLASDEDVLRMLIGDTISDIPLLSDEELTAALALENSNIYSTAERLCRSLSARFGREADLFAGPVRDQKTKQATHFLELAERYAEKTSSGAEIEFAGGVDSAGLERDPFFIRELHLEDTVVSRELNGE